ncbi:FCD domain-containing protein [Cellulomonas hominis]|uniref:FadR/GntR family transcriptional regulator n=1 Tax=Cellulomonas hominis TaxID=156981 RepID=UPI001C113325|nr:FCD domain-containing protein [Cellulomonas hominis]MBU5422055.1 FCD domain-containing protein [Cellulomonas hominis]
MSDKNAPGDSVLWLVERIADLGLADGMYLPSEAELAQAMHAGRPQVREALQVLESFGAVRARQGARRVWLGFDPAIFGLHLSAALGSSERSVQELFEIRHAFESTHVAEVAARMTLSQEDELRRTVATMTKAARRGDSFAEADERFHRILFSSVENRLFEGISAAFWRLHSRIPAANVEEEDLGSVATMHARILESIVTRDIRLASHELDAHFWGVRRRLQVRPEPLGAH